MTTTETIRLAVLISGGGSTMQNLAEHIDRGELPARITQVICSNPKARGIDRAGRLGLPCEVVSRRDYDSSDAFSDRAWSIIREAGADLVCLGGFLSLIRIPDDYVWRVMNVHPALLPSFGGKGMYGHHVHDAVLAAGCKVSGCTVHYADEHYDQGPIIAQRCCAVEEGDTPDALAERVMAEERIAYPHAIRLFAEGRLKVEGDVVRIAGG